MRPDFIGIGVQKCATAWLYSMLAAHPEITMAKTKEGKKDTEFFSCFYDRGLEWYERHFEKKQNEIAGEFSTSYFYNTDAPERVYNYAPEIKLIVSLRHPVERAFSHHKHEIQGGRISGENLVFENALKNNPLYLYQSLYYTHLKKWMRFFSEKNFFIIIDNELRDNPHEMMRKLYSFLGVTSDYNNPMFFQKIHDTRLPENIFIESSIKSISAVLRKIGVGRMVDYLKNKGLKKKIDMLNSKEDSVAFLPMLSETRLNLLEYFSEENYNLSKLINRDVSHWDK